nr:ash family protein [Pectobacterium parvum]
MTAQFIPFPGLPAGAFWRYSFVAAAKSVAGIGVPEITKATPHAPCVFFLCRCLSTPICCAADPFPL